MTPEEAATIKTRMERRIRQLKASVKDLEEITKPVTPDVSIGRLSRLDAINNKSVAERTLREQRKDLEILHHSLSLYGSPDFGKCTRCGEGIQFGRLKFMPESNKCIACAKK